MTIVTGATTAIITPFRNGKLDEQTYAQLIKRQIDNGIDAICPVGTTGESATLTHDEHNRCVEIAVEVAKGTSVQRFLQVQEVTLLKKLLVLLNMHKKQELMQYFL